MKTESKNISRALAYHLEHEIPLTDSVFRYASDAWCDLICEARALYEAGDIEVDEDEAELLESDAGVHVIFNDQPVILDTPNIDWMMTNESDEVKHYVVYTRNESDNIIRVCYEV